MQLPLPASPIQKCATQQLVLGFYGSDFPVLSVLLFQPFSPTVFLAVKVILIGNIIIIILSNNKDSYSR